MSHDDACFWRATLERRGEPVDVGACERGKARNLLNDFLSESDTVRLQKGGVEWSWLECYRRCVVRRKKKKEGQGGEGAECEEWGADV